MSHATGLKASVQRQDAGSIPGPAQWVKGSNCGSDLIPGLGTLYGTGQPKKKKKKENSGGNTKSHLKEKASLFASLYVPWWVFAGRGNYLGGCCDPIKERLKAWSKRGRLS